MVKKVSFVFIIVLLFIFSFITVSSAFTFEDSDGKTYIVSDDILCDNIFVINSSTYVTIFTFDGDVSYTKTETDGDITIKMNCGESGFYRNIALYKSNGNIKSQNDFPVSGYSSYSIDLSRLIYINFDVVDKSGNIIIEKTHLKDKFELNLKIEPSNFTTDVPVMIHTQNISIESMSNYQLEYSLDGENWEICNVMTINDTDGSVYFQYYYEAYKNQYIYFRFKNIETEEYLYETINIENIIVSQDNFNNYIDGVFCPSPFLRYEYKNDSLITITTQKFFEEEIKKLECHYIKYINDEDLKIEDNWNEVNVRSFTDTISGLTTYQFYFDIDNSDYMADGTYIVRFYNEEIDDYTYSTIKINFQEIIDYEEVINNTETKLDFFINFFKERFGFLVYPFELIVDILQRFLYISFEEPVIKIPNINEPFTGEKFISATTFNFNDLLENEVLKNIHDIYLIFVDAIVILGLVNLARIKIMGVFVE